MRPRIDRIKALGLYLGCFALEAMFGFGGEKSPSRAPLGGEVCESALALEVFWVAFPTVFWNVGVFIGREANSLQSGGDDGANYKDTLDTRRG